MINIQKELQKEAKIQRKDFSELDAIMDANRLIAEKGQEDYEMLQKLGMHSSLLRRSEIKGIKMELKKLDEQYEQVFSIEEIEKIATKYALKFLRSSSFCGEVDTEMPQKIREFMKEHNINSTRLEYNFYVLAPPGSFILVDEPRPVDPILFYKIDESRYRLVHKWGTDFTFWRRIIGWKYRTTFNYWLSWFLTIFIPIASVIWCLTPSIWWSLFALLPALIAATLASADEINTAAKGWKEHWRQNYKVGL